MKPLFRDYELGNGFKITATDMRSWTRYEALQLDARGYVVNRRLADFCRRRDAEAKISEWKALDGLQR